MQTLVTLTKVKAFNKPNNLASWENYKPTAVDQTPIAEGESISGHLISKIQLGRPVDIQRVDATYKYVVGLFSTTPVTNIKDDGFETETAAYELKYLNNNPNYSI